MSTITTTMLKKETFSLVFNNRLLKSYIFRIIHWIHKYVYKYYNSNIYKWSELIHKPSLLIEYKYFKYLFQLNIPRPSKQLIQSTLETTIKSNRFDIFQYMIDHLPSLHTELIIKFKHLDADNIFALLAENGRLEFIKFLYQTHKHIKKPNLIDLFVLSPKSGNITLMKWLLKQIGRNNITDQTIDLAIQNATESDQLEVAIWLSDFSLKPKPLTARDQHDILKWLDFKNENLVMDDLIGLARDGRFNILESVLKLEVPFQEYFPNCNFDEMARYCELQLLQQLNDLGVGFTDRSLQYAVETGNIETVRWLIKVITTRPINYSHVMDNAVTSGNLELLKWLHLNVNQGCTAKAMDTAAEINRLDIIMWLHENRSEGCTTKAMDKAAHNHNMEIIEWLHEHRLEGCTKEAMDAAVKNNRFDMVKWLYKNRPEGFSHNSIISAVKNNNLEILQWLIDHIYTEQQSGNESEVTVPYNYIMELAIEYDYYEIVRYLIDTPHDINILEKSCFFGSKETIKYLLSERNLEITRDAFTRSIYIGNFQTFKWLIQFYKEKQFNFDIMSEVVYYDQIEMLKYLYNNRPELRQWSKATLENAFRGNHYDIIIWLLSHPSTNVEFTSNKEMADQSDRLFYFRDYIEDQEKTMHLLLVKAFNGILL